MDPRDPNFIRGAGPDATGYRLLTAETIAQLDGTRRTLQIIVFALAMGVASFAGFVFFNGTGPWTFFGPDRMDIMLALAAACAVMSFIVPPLIGRTLSRSALSTQSSPQFQLTGDPDHDRAIQEAVRIQLTTIIGCALLEGGAFANVAGLMLQDDLGHALVAGILWLGILWRFPTRSRYLRRIEHAVEEARLEQPLSK